MTKAILTLAISGLLVMAAVGCSEDQISAEAGCNSPAQEGEGGGGTFLPHGRSWHAPLKDSLDLFKRPRTLVDRLPLTDCGVADALDFARAPDVSRPPRRPLVEESRRARTGLPGRRQVFVVPTDRGGLCAIATGPGSSFSCGSGSDEPGVVFWNPELGASYVWGVLPNEIVAVAMSGNGATQRIRVRDNVFYVELPSESRLSDLRLVATYEDGTTQRVQWEGPLDSCAEPRRGLVPVRNSVARSQRTRPGAMRAPKSE